MCSLSNFSGVAILTNAPERLPSKKDKEKDKKKRETEENDVPARPVDRAPLQRMSPRQLADPRQVCMDSLFSLTSRIEK